MRVGTLAVSGWPVVEVEFLSQTFNYFVLRDLQDFPARPPWGNVTTSAPNKR